MLCVQMRGRMQEGERLIRDERLRIEKLKDSRQQRLRMLEARQRMENFERQLSEQQGVWKTAAVEHERQVHQVRAFGVECVQRPEAFFEQMRVWRQAIVECRNKLFWVY